MTEREVMADLVRFVGVITYGKERWFKQNGCWYDRLFGDYIQNETLLDRLIEAIEDEVSCDSADRPTGEWIEDGYCDRHCVCSHCGGSSGTQFDGVQSIPLKTKFCPNCGAKMVKDEVLE